jgi:CheY-like chemotaxis protein
MNLAINAMDAMPSGGRLELVVSGLDLEPADLATRTGLEPGRYACLRVRDTGHGIPLSIIDRVFEPFFTTKGAGKGTGLGLATIDGIARQHGGAISVRNLPAGGCEVELLLPCLPREREQVAGDRSGQQQLARGDGETVILVEDDPMVRDLVERILVKQGFAVRAFDSGQRCRDALAEAPEPADLLLSDVVMPGLNGPDLRDQLEANGQSLPVLFMSGYAGDALSRCGLAEGKAEFLPKPVIIEDLLRKICGLLS